MGTFSDSVLTYTILTGDTVSVTGLADTSSSYTPPATITIPSQVTNTTDSISYTYNVTQIGRFAFNTFSTDINIPIVNPNTTTTKITIPNSVTNIEGSAFGACTALKNLNLPSVTSIGNSAFGSLDSLTINSDNGAILSFGYQALAYIQTAPGKNTLESLTFGGSVDANTPVPGGITQNTDGSYSDGNAIFDNSLVTSPPATVQVPGPAPPNAFPYSSSIVQAINSDIISATNPYGSYPQDTKFDFKYCAVTTTGGVDYVFSAP